MSIQIGIQNLTSSSLYIKEIQVTVPANQTVFIGSYDFFVLAEAQSLKDAITADEAFVVRDGVVLSKADSLAYVTTPSTGTGEVNTASNVGAGEGVFKQKTGTDLEFKSLVAGSSISIVSGTDDITISSTGSASEPNVVNVLTAGDLPSTLAANTTYIVNGSVSTSTPITSVGDNAAIVGRKGRDSDILTYTGTGSFITFVDVNFTLRNVTLKSTNATSLLLDGTNYTG